MTCRETILIAPLSILFSLALTTSGNAESSLALQSTPKLNVLLYSFPEVAPLVLDGAEIEAERMLHPVSVSLNWVKCATRVVPAACLSPQPKADLIVRLLPKALGLDSARALGITGSSGGYDTVFIFYDRILALRSYTRLLHVMLGRVLAHEITHLLLPQQDHTYFGLMRGLWSTDDLQTTSIACLGLSAPAVQSLHQEALRRMLAARAAPKH